MKSIYHSKQLVIGIIFMSLVLVLGAWTEDNLTYKATYLCFAAVFLFFSIYALRLPAIRIEDTAIHVRQFFGFCFKTVSRAGFSSYEKIGKSRLYICGPDGSRILKLGMFSPQDIEQILASLSLKQNDPGKRKT